MLSAQNQAHRVRNIVLVHGAWTDGSGWKGVYDILVKDGNNVSIVQEPETSFWDDVTAVKRILTVQDGPSILVAHSYEGAVITEAGADWAMRRLADRDNRAKEFSDPQKNRMGDTCPRGS